MTATEEAKLLNTVRRHAFQDELRHLKTRQGAFDAAMYHLDHPVPGTDFYLVPSDHGRGAAALYAALEVEPLWRRLWRNARKTLTPRQRRVLDALLEDLRPYVAARLSGVGKNYVYTCLRKIFKVHFAQCFRAYKRTFEL